MKKKLTVVMLSVIMLIIIQISFKGEKVNASREAAAAIGGEPLEKATVQVLGGGSNDLGKGYSDELNRMGLRVMLKVIKEPMNKAEKVIEEEIVEEEVVERNIEVSKEVIDKPAVHKVPEDKKVTENTSKPQKALEKPAVVENKKEAAPVQEPAPEKEKEKVISEEIMKDLPSKHPISYRGDIEEEILALVNQLRVNNGLSPFTSIGILKESSRYKSNSMVQLEYFSHSNPNFNNENSGYLLLKVFKVNSTKVGENIAMYTDRREERINARGLYDLWYNSEPHRKAMLSDSYTKIGIGVVTTLDSEGRIKIYGTQHFAK